MSGQKRAASCSGSSGSCDDVANKKQKRQITVSTFNKWQSQFHQEHKTLCWLKCDKEVDRRLVSTLWCAICRKYETNICGLKNFSSAWIVGSSNQRTSNVLDHATSNQHKAAMVRFNKDQARANNDPEATSASPIARCLLRLSPSTKARLSRKFDICYLLAKEGMAFKKYPGILELESRHEVDIGPAYRNDTSAQLFTSYIAESQRKAFLESFSQKHFFSFMIDGTTDSGNLEDELTVILYCRKDEGSGEIKSCARYLSVDNPERADTEGLTKCLSKATRRVGLDSVLDAREALHFKPILIGGGTDGASVNIAQHHSIKEQMQKSLPWLFWSWCYSHRLELAAKHGLISSLFKGIEEMLLRVYYLYEKSPKKTRELASIVQELKGVFEFPQGCGNMPVRSQGSRWITHKRKALQRVIDRYGAYICHLTALSEDSSLKSEDRAKFTGYLRKWSDAKILVGCALYVDVIKPPSLLSLTLQGSDLDIVFAMKQILKQKENGETTYQGSALKNYSPATVQHCKKEALADLKRLQENMCHRLEWSDIKLLRSLLAFVETQSWIKRSADDEHEDASLFEIKQALERIYRAFSLPLDSVNVNLSTLQDEIEDAVAYAREYLSLESTNYRKVWYLLHICPDSGKWPNVLLLCELVFSLPFSNGRVEQIFSSLKVIKTSNRTSLRTSTLDDLLEICIEGPPLSDFSPDSAIDLWWKDCRTTRRPSQSKRKPYRPRTRPDATRRGEQSSTSTDGDADPDSTRSESPDVDCDPDSDSSEEPDFDLPTVLQDWDNLFL